MSQVHRIGSLTNIESRCIFIIRSSRTHFLKLSDLTIDTKALMWEPALHI